MKILFNLTRHLSGPPLCWLNRGADPPPPRRPDSPRAPLSAHSGLSPPQASLSLPLSLSAPGACRPARATGSASRPSEALEGREGFAAKLRGT